jgi:hypothetical protein
LLQMSGFFMGDFCINLYHWVWFSKTFYEYWTLSIV